MRVKDRLDPVESVIYQVNNKMDAMVLHHVPRLNERMRCARLVPVDTSTGGLP